MLEHRGDDGVVALGGNVHTVRQEPPEAAEEVAAARDHQRKERGDDRAAQDGGLVFDGVKLLRHLRQAPGAQRGQDDHAEQVQRVRPQEGGERAGRGGYRGVGHRRQLLQRLGQAAELGQGGRDDGHNAGEHDDALDKVVHHGGHVAARNDVDGREHSHEENADRVVNVKGHGKQARQAVVQRGGIGDQKQEDDERRAGAEGRAAIPLVEKIRHGFALKVLRHHAGAPAKDGPGHVGADERVSEADPGGGDAVFPAELPGIAHENDRGKVGGAVGKGRKPRPHRPRAQHKAVHVAGVPAAVEADGDHQREEYQKHQQF